ncbi:uncharacterized protein LOC107641286 [Arachis ipaensis]|uniref:uncharacterized protein LOC107641286 n=1 Tax=Arachis ipaensis TaxID=130454 RepID=UPI0007AFDC39|nr:uncharacterized protein LOC107641286 [Arachis ipaensis]XP_025653273.1 uncharacterized protein LOC112749228 [Arachis hypogaea]
MIHIDTFYHKSSIHTHEYLPEQQIPALTLPTQSTTHIIDPCINNDLNGETTEHTSIDNLHTIDSQHLVSLRRSTIEYRKHAYLKDFQCMSASIAPPSKCTLLCYNALSTSHRFFSLAISIDKELRSYEDVIAYDCWRSAIKEELDALQQLQTWEIQALSFGKKAIGCKWVFKLKQALKDIRQSGYSQSKSDNNLFTKYKSSGFTTLLVYIDDVTLAGNDISEINFIKALLHEKLCIKGIGDLKFFLGMEVARSREGIALYQRKYALDLLQDSGMEQHKPASTPMDYGT